MLCIIAHARALSGCPCTTICRETPSCRLLLILAENTLGQREITPHGTDWNLALTGRPSHWHALRYTGERRKYCTHPGGTRIQRFRAIACSKSAYMHTTPHLAHQRAQYLPVQNTEKLICTSFLWDDPRIPLFDRTLDAFFDLGEGVLVLPVLTLLP